MIELEYPGVASTGKIQKIVTIQFATSIKQSKTGTKMPCKREELTSEYLQLLEATITHFIPQKFPEQ